MNKTKDKIIDGQDVKYCVCAMIDLLGFSSHLEISGYDLRTSIGQQAIKRLENLEKVLSFLNSEKINRKEHYPSDFHLQRINDAVFVTMDLDSALTPEIGNMFFQGLSSKDSHDSFSEEQKETWEQYQAAYSLKMYELVDPLTKLIGFISRLHLSINKIEGAEFFPGAKTVISTGYRKSFLSAIGNKEDYFSANFAMANAYTAEKLLRGPNLYIDGSILQLMSYNKFAKNILQFAHFQFKKASFDCFENHDDVFNLTSESNIPKPFEIQLFRKDYQFRQLNSAPLTYLQNLPLLMPYLLDEMEPDLTNIYYKHIYNAIKKGIAKNKMNELKAPPSFVFNGANDLKNDIGIFYEFISTGKSNTREELTEKKFQADHANLSEEGKAKIKEYMQQEVQIELTTVKIEECINSLYELDESTLSVLSLMLEGDIELLDYKDINSIVD